MAAFTGECQQEFVTAFFTFHPREAVMEDAAVQEAVDNGETLINCLAYIDLNPIRAGIMEKPEEYRWSSLGYHVQSGNKDRFVSLDFGLREFGVKSEKDRWEHYRFVNGFLTE